MKNFIILMVMLIALITPVSAAECTTCVDNTVPENDTIVTSSESLKIIAINSTTVDALGTVTTINYITISNEADEPVDMDGFQIYDVLNDKTYNLPEIEIDASEILDIYLNDNPYTAVITVLPEIPDNNTIELRDSEGNVIDAYTEYVW